MSVVKDPPKTERFDDLPQLEERISGRRRPNAIFEDRNAAFRRRDIAVAPASFQQSQARWSSPSTPAKVLPQPCSNLGSFQPRRRGRVASQQVEPRDAVAQPSEDRPPRPGASTRATVFNPEADLARLRRIRGEVSPGPTRGEAPAARPGSSSCPAAQLDVDCALPQLAPANGGELASTPRAPSSRAPAYALEPVSSFLRDAFQGDDYGASLGFHWSWSTSATTMRCGVARTSSPSPWGGPEAGSRAMATNNATSDLVSGLCASNRDLPRVLALAAGRGKLDE